MLCEALDLIGKTPPGDAGVNGDHGQFIAKHLDLRSFPSSMFQLTDDTKFTLLSLFPNEIETTRSSVTYKSDDWVLSLDLVAILDVNHNGLPDWIIWLADESKKGNYRSYSTLVSFDVSETTPTMSAVPYELAVSDNAIPH